MVTYGAPNVNLQKCVFLSYFSAKLLIQLNIVEWAKMPCGVRRLWPTLADTQRNGVILLLSYLLSYLSE